MKAYRMNKSSPEVGLGAVTATFHSYHGWQTWSVLIYPPDSHMSAANALLRCSVAERPIHRSAGS